MLMLGSTTVAAAVAAGWAAAPVAAHVAREAPDDASCKKTTVAIL